MSRPPPSTAAGTPRECFHCGDPVPTPLRWQVEIDGTPQPMCCAGCEAIARTILEAGLDDYYRLRSELPGSARERVPAAVDELSALGRPAVQRHYARDTADGLREALLLITGIECAACAWLVERRLAGAPGIREAEVNFSTHRARLRWDPRQTDLGALATRVRELGYGVLPYAPERGEDAIEVERVDRLRRLGVAGLFGMQIMMVAVALYAGSWWGMEPAIEQLFRWFSMALCLPVLVFSAAPFFKTAVRGLVNRAPGMDLPVSLGIAVAFGASAWSTLRGQGEIYFDSVAMFTFALLLARYLEMLARRRAHQQVEALVVPTPQLARRVLHDGTLESVPAVELQVGEHVRVMPGETIPADGTLDTGFASVDESLLSGESRPLTRAPGEPLLAGSINIAQPIDMRVSRVGPQTLLCGIVALVERAAAERPHWVMLADCVAAVFVLAVVGVAAAVAVAWFLHSPHDWLSPTIAVLVVTCPCALSLATPTAMTAAATLVSRAGLIPSRGLALEALTRVDRVVFDKTGTLTRGTLTLRELRPLGGLGAQRCLRLAAAIERSSAHPIATALRELCEDDVPPATRVRAHPGRGMEAEVEGKRWVLGTPGWVQEQLHTGIEAALVRELEADGSTVVLLASEGEPACAFRLGDTLRADACEVVSALKRQGVRVTILSGDRPAAVTHVARALGVDEAHAGLVPDEKLALLRSMQRRGEAVVAVGDGVNDAPLLSAARVSIAMAEGAQLARASADFILINGRLDAIPHALRIARTTRRVVRQNLLWALAYNLLALPAAGLGYVAPWAAAIGMSLSSLLVVGNSYRLYRTGEERGGPAEHPRRRAIAPPAVQPS